MAAMKYYKYTSFFYYYQRESKSNYYSLCVKIKSEDELFPFFLGCWIVDQISTLAVWLILVNQTEELFLRPRLKVKLFASLG